MAYRLDVTVQDADGMTSSVSFYTSEATFATASAWANAVLAAINTLIEGAIVSADLAFQLSTGALRAIPLADSDVEEKGRFIFNVVGGYTSRISLPTFAKETYTVTGGNIDTGDADVVQFINALLSGGGAQGTDYRYDNLTSVKAAYEAFEGRRR